MKKIILLLCFAILSCTDNKSQQNHQEQNIQEMPFKIERSLLESYMRVLPLVLRQSHEFRDTEDAKKLKDSQYNIAFYHFLFSNEDTKIALQKAGFTGAEEFSKFHETVLEIFLMIKQSPDIVEKSVEQIPYIEKELPRMQLKLAREPYNKTLQANTAQLAAADISYRNIILIDTVKSNLETLNKNAENI